MKPWQRRTIGILTVGGGATGVAVLLAHVLGTSHPVPWLFSMIGMGIYAWGTWCGVKLLEASPGAEESTMRYWLLQIPTVSSPVFSFFLAGGFHFTIALQVAPLNLHWTTQIGSVFNYSLLNFKAPWSLGVNLAAVAVVFFLYGQVTRPATQAEPEPDPDTPEAPTA